MTSTRNFLLYIIIYVQASAAFGRACFSAQIGRPQRAQCYYNLHVEMCVSVDSKKLLTCHCIALCKTPKFSSSPANNTAPPFGARICAACQGSAV